MQASETKLKGLSGSAGVDLLALKQKYEGVRNTQIQREKEEEGHQEKETTERDIQADYNTLDKYKICKRCGGQGIVKEIYNHMVLDKTCEECDGDCIQIFNLPKWVNKQQEELMNKKDNGDIQDEGMTDTVNAENPATDIPITTTSSNNNDASTDAVDA